MKNEKKTYAKPVVIRRDKIAAIVAGSMATL